MKKSQVLTFGFTAGTLFDMKSAEAIFDNSSETDKHQKYRDYFKKMNENGEILKPGPALGLYIALHHLKQKLPKDLILMRFGISCRFDTDHAGVDTLTNSLAHYLLTEKEDFMPDYISLTGVFSQANAHKIQNADLVFTSSDNSAKEYHNSGIASIHIPNIDEDQNMRMYNNRNSKINFIFDFDGVVADPSSELVYQAAKKIDGLDPINTFRLNEIEKMNTPIPLGPLGVFIIKTSVIVEHYQKLMLANKIQIKDIPFETRILTARGGAASLRVLKSMNHYHMQVSRADFADGNPKYIALSMLEHDEINLFMEDSFIHVEGARNNTDHVLAGLVFNDYTSGKLTLEAQVEELKKKYHKE